MHTAISWPNRDGALLGDSLAISFSTLFNALDTVSDLGLRHPAVLLEASQYIGRVALESTVLKILDLLEHALEHLAPSLGALILCLSESLAQSSSLDDLTEKSE